MRPAVAEVNRPATVRSRVRRDATVNLRMPEQVRDLIDSAATASGKTRTEFVVESARQNAIDVLLDRRLFNLPDGQFEAFMRVLDNPPKPTEKLKELMAAKAPWEK